VGGCATERAASIGRAITEWTRFSAGWVAVQQAVAAARRPSGRVEGRQALMPHKLEPAAREEGL
jgi:hypothetical protein